jgi:hypothetical protein
MAFNVDEFVADITSGVSLDEDTRQVLLNTIKNPTIAKRLEEGTLRQSDFSRKQAEYDNKIRKAQDYWDGLVTWKTDKEVEFKQQEDLFKKKLTDSGVSLEDGSASTGVRPEQLEELAKQSVAYQNAITRLGMQHLKDYNEVLDPDKVLEVASRERININQAYEMFVKPKREEIQKAEFDKAILKAREEGAQEAIKNYTVPVSQGSEFHGNTHALDGLTTNGGVVKNEYGVMAAVKAFSDAQRLGKLSS